MAIVADLNAVHSDVIRIMQELYGDRLAQIILYGSYALGDYHEESDVDFDYLVVLTDEHVAAFTEVGNIAPVLYKSCTKFSATVKLTFLYLLYQSFN